MKKAITINKKLSSIHSLIAMYLAGNTINSRVDEMLLGNR